MGFGVAWEMDVRNTAGMEEIWARAGGYEYCGQVWDLDMVVSKSSFGWGVLSYYFSHSSQRRE